MITPKQEGVQARAIKYLMAHGEINAWVIMKMGTTDARKMITRLRRMGLLYPLDDPRAYVDVPNAHGTARYRIHYWTGQQLKAA